MTFSTLCLSLCQLTFELLFSIIYRYLCVNCFCSISSCLLSDLYCYSFRVFLLVFQQTFYNYYCIIVYTLENFLTLSCFLIFLCFLNAQETQDRAKICYSSYHSTKLDAVLFFLSKVTISRFTHLKQQI